ncbi:MAG: hypothetical protein M9904_18610 [Chitinophagaceae bacterium]|nr:hypothetical protein [Chitinophagaceae bacterium]
MQDIYIRSKKTLLLWTLVVGLLLASFTNYPAVILISLLLTLYTFGELVLALGKIVPVKEITALLMVVQLLLAPFLDYAILAPQEMSAMAVDQKTYFSFALPAVLAFLIGMRFRFRRPKIIQGEMDFSETDRKRHNKIGIILIVIGYVFLFLQNVLVIPGLEFVIVVLSLFRFVGIFYLMYSNNRFYQILILAVAIPATISTVRGSVFIDLLIWFFFIYAFAAIKFRIRTRITMLIVALSIIFFMILQSVKVDYRKIEWRSNRVTQETTGVSLFADIFSANLQSLNKANLWLMQAKFITRLNQGFIVSYVLKKDVVKTTNKTNTYLGRELLGVVLPRFIYSEKATVGDNKKFRYLTGIPLATSVSMNVGILGDGYGNFGYAGGIFFCFCFGFFLNLVMGYCFSLSRRIKTILFWMPLILFYVMRAGNEFYIITNWTVKVAFVVIAYYFISKKYFGKAI